MTTANLNDYEWLVSNEGRAWLASLADSPRRLVQQTRHLRKHLSAARTHLLLETIELRQRGTAKFSAAGQMFFTARGLEQATDQWIASHKAQRFPTDQPIADLCCGIGGDLFGLAQRKGLTTGVDRHPLHTLLATANCEALGLDLSGVETGDVATMDMSRFAAWHLDPDRRPTGNRTTQLEFTAPPWRVVRQLLAQQPHAAIKSAPATELPDDLEIGVERHWIGSGRECKQQVIWCGNLARHPGQHSASVVHHHAAESELLVGKPDEPVEVAPRIDRFLCVPHATVSAAQLTGALARRHNLLAIDSQVDYLTSSEPIDDPLLSCFEILESLPFDLRHVKALLQRAGVGIVEVKKRGVHIDPEKVRRKLKLKGPHQASLLIAPRAGSVTAFLCRRRTL